jgi:hypothetical protein
MAPKLGEECIRRLVKNLSWKTREFSETCASGYSHSELCKHLQEEQIKLLTVLFGYYFEFPMKDVKEVGFFIVRYLCKTNF